MKTLEDFKGIDLFGRNARLLYEWEKIDQYCKGSDEVSYLVRKTNPDGLPIFYEIEYRIHTFCGIEQSDDATAPNPIYADKFIMNIKIPNNYPSLDSKLEFKFALKDINGNDIPHPWHPNIRYFGDFAGRVCLTTDLYGSYTDLAFYVDRVTEYLKYDAWNADENMPPYPEDAIVAKWVNAYGEPRGWIDDLRKYHRKNRK